MRHGPVYAPIFNQNPWILKPRHRSCFTDVWSYFYLAYASFKAIETPGKADDTQWLTYWTVFGFVQTVEYFADILLYWFPFWYTFKVLFFLWLALPQFRVS
jgi:receptor expression-enhancing protein 5/6